MIIKKDGFKQILSDISITDRGNEQLNKEGQNFDRDQNKSPRIFCVVTRDDMTEKSLNAVTIIDIMSLPLCCRNYNVLQLHCENEMLHTPSGKKGPKN